MFIWILLIAVLAVAAYIFFKIKTPAKSQVQNLTAKDFLPKVIELKEKSPYDWAKIINTLNPQNDSAIQEILIELKNKEVSTAKVVLEKFIQFADENPDWSLKHTLNRILDKSKSYSNTESRFNDENRR